MQIIPEYGNLEATDQLRFPGKGISLAIHICYISAVYFNLLPDHSQYSPSLKWPHR